MVSPTPIPSPGAYPPIIRTGSPPQKQTAILAPIPIPIAPIPHHAVPPPTVAGRPTPPPLQLPSLTHRRRADPGSSSDGAVRARIQAPAGPNNQPGWRQGKPLFEWITRKLGARRGSDATAERPPVPHYVPKAHRRPEGRRLHYRRADRNLSPGDASVNRNSVDTNRPESMSMSLRSYSFSASQTPSERRREANNPYPSIPVPMLRRSYPASTIDSGSRPPSLSVFSRSRTPSVASLSDLAARGPRISIADDAGGGGSLAGCADEDASVRPIPPSPTSMSVTSRSGSMPLWRSDSASAPRRVRTTSPPPIVGRRDTIGSSVGASYTSEEDTQSRQNSLASTKPTTVMSFESASPAHIAVAPSLSSSPPVHRTMSSPTTTATSIGHLPSPVSTTFAPLDEPSVRVPLHSRYHPRNNPHPSAAPRPDASIVTLASSNFALAPSPVDRTAARPGSLRLRETVSPSAYHAPHITSPTVAFADRPGSMHDGVSTHALSLSVRTRSYGRADDDASMRAIRRRGSWESGESRWSWRPGPSDAPMLHALNRRSELLAEGDDVASPARSLYTREYRVREDEEHGEPVRLHRPVSVKV
ncbi:hypothetical protein CC85DRAFT_100090 [Cutaneotrichosporon oleaginosum]|uniref:Uncharacterized protein n=1 Tax=Cutaneotrichosporon oleaginosum TaxID=879819 RepID=A0A0J0XLK3_9TREE|nr:uncharacterized protein CC85DRAFT_100090 [Cutaneotrichosporon oleaginosum]KLT41965.1 hypothetical protein CC85DRAFT_100090 [Cutaneotrichosporon oleaginosum]TXT14374.1 hypothetical protein COLE_00567 [Cutaneotrichosporon oleaginosum]